MLPADRLVVSCRDRPCAVQEPSAALEVNVLLGGLAARRCQQGGDGRGVAAKGPEPAAQEEGSGAVEQVS